MKPGFCPTPEETSHSPRSPAISQPEAAVRVRKPQSFGRKGSTNQLPRSLVPHLVLVRGGGEDDGQSVQSPVIRSFLNSLILYLTCHQAIQSPSVKTCEKIRPPIHQGSVLIRVRLRVNHRLMTGCDTIVPKSCVYPVAVTP